MEEVKVGKRKSQPVWGDFCDQMVAENAKANRNPEDEYVAGREVIAAMFNAGR
jgi:hypothetical protein